MPDIKAIIDEIHAEISKLESGAADRIRALVDKLTGHLPEAEAEAKADAEQVAKDAVAAVEPVVNEAVQDVAAVGETAVAGDATAPSAETKNT